MLFDCVQVNTGLGFQWICNSEKKGGIYVNWWILERYQHFNTFDTGIVNGLIHDKN